MDSPESRGLLVPPWLFGKQGLAILALVAAIAATFVVLDIAFLAGCLLLIGVLGRLWTYVGLKKVGFERRTLQARAFAGDDVLLESTVANPRPLPLPWLEIWEQIPLPLEPEGPRERSFSDPNSAWVPRGLSLWPYQRLRWRRKLHCRVRGVHRLGEVRLRTGDPFGFFECDRAFRDQVEVLVYPRVVRLGRLGLQVRHPSLDVGSRNSPVVDPTRTATVREYRPDDPRRLIHWATTARHNALQVRVLEPATSLHASLVLDVRGFTFGIYSGELLELALSALASAAVYLQENGFPVALFMNSNPPVALAAGASVGHLQHVLEAMARLQPLAGPPLMPWALHEVPRGSSVILAASEMSSELPRALAQLAHVSVLPLIAASQAPRVPARAGARYITPGCDVATLLEGTA